MTTPSKLSKVDMAKDSVSLKESDKFFMKKLADLNAERVSGIKVMRKKNMVTGLLIVGGVFGIYFYTMYAVRQERFLDDFDKVPEKESVPSS